MHVDGYDTVRDNFKRGSNVHPTLQKILESTVYMKIDLSCWTGQSSTREYYIHHGILLFWGFYFRAYIINWNGSLVTFEPLLQFEPTH